MIIPKNIVSDLALIATCVAFVAMLATGCTPSTSVESSNANNSQNISSSSAASSSSSSAVSSEANKDFPFSAIPGSALITAEDLHRMMGSSDELFVLDVRSAGQYTNGFIPGSKNIPAGRQIDLRLDEIPTDKTIVVISSGESRLGEVWQTLLDAGFDKDKLLVVSDGIEAWKTAGYPIDSRESLSC